MTLGKRTIVGLVPTCGSRRNPGSDPRALAGRGASRHAGEPCEALKWVTGRRIVRFTLY